LTLSALIASACGQKRRAPSAMFQCETGAGSHPARVATPGDLRQYLLELRRERRQLESVLNETTDPEVLDNITYRLYALDREQRRVLRLLRGADA